MVSIALPQKNIAVFPERSLKRPEWENFTVVPQIDTRVCGVASLLSSKVTITL